MRVRVEAMKNPDSSPALEKFRLGGVDPGPSNSVGQKSCGHNLRCIIHGKPTPYFARIGTLNRDGAVVGQPSRLSWRASRPRRILGRDAPAAGGTPAPLPRGSLKALNPDTHSDAVRASARPRRRCLRVSAPPAAIPVP